MAHRRSSARSGKRSTGRTSGGLPIVKIALAVGGAYLLWQHLQAQKAAAADAAATQAAIAAADLETRLLPSLT